MDTVESFIDALRGTSSVAGAMCLAPITVSCWKAAGNIPKWRIRDLANGIAYQAIAMPLPFPPSQIKITASRVASLVIIGAWLSP